jgi:hypothetical protein
MGANDAYWQVRYEANDRVIVGYKSTADPIADPSLKTILFRALTPPRPECELIGIQHQGGRLDWSGGDYAVVPSSLDNPWFAGTGFDPSSVLRGLVGVETDTIPDAQSADSSCGNKLTVFFHRAMGGDTLGNADAVAYTAPSGAVVFAAGSKRFVWGLADGSLSPVHGLVDPRLQLFVRNMLNDLSATRTADLSVSLTANPARETAGRTVKVVAMITNNGPDEVRRATLDVALPPGIRFVRVASTGLKCTLVPIRCAIERFPAGSEVKAVFTLRASTTQAAAIRTRIFATTAMDPNPSSALARVVIHRKIRTAKTRRP